MSPLWTGVGSSVADSVGPGTGTTHRISTEKVGPGVLRCASQVHKYHLIGRHFRIVSY